MKKVFIDANILIDYLSSRTKEEDRQWAIAVIDYCNRHSNRAFISTHSFMVLFHILEKEFENKAVLKIKLEEAYNLFNVIPVTNEDMSFGFKSIMADFEDSVQLSCALGVNADFIVTNNVQDFYDTNIIVIPPDQFFDFI